MPAEDDDVALKLCKCGHARNQHNPGVGVFSNCRVVTASHSGIPLAWCLCSYYREPPCFNEFDKQRTDSKLRHDFDEINTVIDIDGYYPVRCSKCGFSINWKIWCNYRIEFQSLKCPERPAANVLQRLPSPLFKVKTVLK